MATYFHESDASIITIIPPNSEVGMDWQRFGNRPRTVGGYYVSRKGEEVKTFLYDFYGSYSIDLLKSYFLCKELYENLIQNCSGYYCDGLRNLKQTINYINALLADRKEAELVFEAHLSLTDSGKYLHIDNINDNSINLFKKMILGDIIEIVIKKVNDKAFTIYLRPRKGVTSYLADSSLFGRWLNDNTN